MQNLNKEYWENRYKENKTGWDVGYANPSLIKFCLNVIPYETKILIPGCGNAYEGAELYNNGFHNITLLDISEEAISSAKAKHPELPSSVFKQGDFFDEENQYELIIEQTFFCALDPDIRSNYVDQLYKLLVPNGMVIGVLFNKDFEGGPPFGGSAEEYTKLFERKFEVVRMDQCYDSIPQRQGTEVFFVLRKFK